MLNLPARSGLLVGAVLISLSGVAEAEDVPSPPPVPVPEPEPEPHVDADERADDAEKPAKLEKADKAEKKSKAEKPSLEIGGRVFVRETVSSVDGGPWLGELSLDSARVEVTFRHKKVRAVVEMEAAGNDVELRDGYLRLDLPARTEVRAGHFKIPLSPIENTSTWRLPTIDRGLLSDVFDDSFRLTGRRPGAQAEWRGAKDAAWQPRAAVGAFQGEGLGGDPAPAEAEDGLGLDAAGRVALVGELGVEVGLAGSWRVMQPTPGAAPERYWAASLDAEVQVAGLRLWAEGYVGSLSKLFDVTPTMGGDPTFVAGRLLVAWRAGGREDNDWYVEPFFLASALDGNLDVSDDLATEVAGGVAGGRWQRLRLQLQVQVWREGANSAPLLEAGGGALVDQEAVVLQLGAAF